MTQPVKWFASDMAGAPACSGQAGVLISLLNACLVDGFNLLTLDSLVVAGNVATGTKAGHGYKLHQIVEIAGASPVGLNGQWRVTEVSTNTFKFATTGISDQTATGTITAKTASAGWLKPYTGTNKATFRSQKAGATQCHIRVDDSVALYATVTGYESMTDVDTGTKAFGPHYFKKSSAADATSRPWVMIADERGFYLGIAWSNTTTYDFYHFGDFDTLIAGDAWACRLQGLAASGPGTIGQYSSVSEATPAAVGYARTSLTPRTYAAIYTQTALLQHSMSGGQCIYAQGITSTPANAASNFSGIHGYQNAQSYDQFASPSPGDAGYHYFPVFLVEVASSQKFLRGSCRGLLHVYEYNPTFSGSYTIQEGVQNVSGGLVMMIRSAGETQYPLYPQTTLAFNLGDWG